MNVMVYAVPVFCLVVDSEKGVADYLRISFLPKRPESSLEIDMPILVK